MKMTRLEWRYLQRIALDHPYFDTHKLPLTEKEAKAIVKENIKMTGREFVDSIYAKLGMTRPEEKKDHFAWLHSIGELFTVPPIRKIAIAVLVVVLMTVFFAATPTGRAIAESVIQYIATLFEDGRLVINQSDKGTTLTLLDNQDESFNSEQQSGEGTIAYVDSFDEFVRSMGQQPVILPLHYTELYYEYDESVDYLSLHTTYETPNGRIVTFQTWGAEDSISSTLAGFMNYDADDSIYYSIEGEGKIIIHKVFEDSVFGMSEIGTYTLDELIGMLKGI